jgi:hypothetical protein
MNLFWVFPWRIFATFSLNCGFSSGAHLSQGGNKGSVVKSLMVSLGFKWVKEFLGPSSYFSRFCF